MFSPRAWMAAAGRLAAVSIAAAAFACGGGRSGGAGVPGVFVVEVHDELNVAVQARLMRALRQARETDGSVVVVSLDTPGGPVTVMEEMGDALRKASADGKLQTVAFVPGGRHGGAFSAGAFVAIACNSLYMAKYTNIGGALPVVPAMTGSGFGLAAADDLAEGKIIATLAARFRSYAQQTSRSPGIAAAFVDPMLGVYRVRLASGSEAVLDSTEILALRERGEVVERVQEIQPVGSGRPLVLAAQTAFETGFIGGIVDTLPDLLRVLGRENAPVETLPASSGERLVRFVDMATPVLILLGVILGFLEAKIPGFGLAGVLSTLCFSLVFYGRYLLGAAEWLEGILFVLGLMLVIVELFVAPGTLYAGVLGGILIAAALFLSYQNFLVPRDFIDFRILTNNVAWTSGIFLASILGMALVSKVVPKTPVVRSLTLEPPADLEGTGGTARLEAVHVGRVVRAQSDLRPAGVLEIDGRRIDAMSEGEFIERGAEVVVTRVDGNRVVVTLHRPEGAA